MLVEISCVWLKVTHNSELTHNYNFEVLERWLPNLRLVCMKMLQENTILCCIAFKGHLNIGLLPALRDFAFLGCDKSLMHLQDDFVSKYSLE